MVPNHMGIDSPWVIEHPEWFISRQDSPYPAYSFNGPDLSHDGRVEIKIEDHYFEQSDAAVVFRRRDNASGETRYIYHGNDGTSFPWNDTAQLDYLNPAVREQVIQTILHVARLFPVIRFDAAMTLAKRHFHRLWFPGPGSSGAIPSRAEYGMSQAEFDRCMPHEFWREVVDRVAAEVPGTLLLAEAFWLMEGYFVRTLGMHRVYNSAFMVMLRDEDNAKYRSVIKNTLEFDPDIMKRYVNFMSNPDERTAIDQFGNGRQVLRRRGHDGHAARPAHVRPRPDRGLHREVRHGVPLAPLRRDARSLAGRAPRARDRAAAQAPLALCREQQLSALRLLHRRRLGRRKRLRLLQPQRRRARPGRLQQPLWHNARHHRLLRRLRRQGRRRNCASSACAKALASAATPAPILAFRDSLTGLEYLRRASDLLDHGLTLELHAYQCHVFLDWRELRSTAAVSMGPPLRLLNYGGGPQDASRGRRSNRNRKPADVADELLADAQAPQT